MILNLLIKEGGELGEVVGLPGGLVLPNHLDCELGYLCGFKDSVKGNIPFIIIFTINNIAQVHSTQRGKLMK